MATETIRRIQLQGQLVIDVSPLEPIDGVMLEVKSTDTEANTDEDYTLELDAEMALALRDAIDTSLRAQKVVALPDRAAPAKSREARIDVARSWRIFPEKADTRRIEVDEYRDGSAVSVSIGACDSLDPFDGEGVVLTPTEWRELTELPVRFE